MVPKRVVFTALVCFLCGEIIFSLSWTDFPLRCVASLKELWSCGMNDSDPRLPQRVLHSLSLFSYSSDLILFWNDLQGSPCPYPQPH